MFETFILAMIIMSGCMALLYFGKSKIKPFKNPFKKDDDDK